MDPLSITASLIATIQITGKVSSLCWDFRSSVKNARNDIARILEEINSLRSVLEALVKLAEDSDQENESTLSVLKSLAAKDGALPQCHSQLERIEKELQKYATSNGKRGKHALLWPFKEKDVSNHLSHISRFKQTLQLALVTDQMSSNLNIWRDVKSIKSSLDEAGNGRLTTVLIRVFIDHLPEEKRRMIRNWLDPPDISSNLSEARRRCEPNTGGWFLRSDDFEEWKYGSSLFMWLYGIPGCGKTVLTSSIIDDVSRTCCIDSASALAYFYFDFADKKKQSLYDLLRSVVAQLLQKNLHLLDQEECPSIQMWNAALKPSCAELLKVLRTVINKFEHVYLVFDALDESADRDEVLNGLNEIVDWKLSNLHILVTSREEIDIETALTNIVDQQIRLEGKSVDEDIRTYIHQSISKDPKFRKWSREIQNEIAQSLSIQCQGMFRWAACQLETLRKCCKLSQLREALKCLPRTLNGTYERILAGIDPSLVKDAHKILHWLCFAFHPPTLDDVAEMLAVDLDDGRYDPDQLLTDPMDILTICGSLVTLGADGALKLSHYSVQEYLLNKGTWRDAEPHFRFLEPEADAAIAETCLVYLLSFKFSSREEMNAARPKHTLLRYSVNFWPEHYRRVSFSPNLFALALRLLDPSSSFLNWGWMGGLLPDGFVTEIPHLPKYGSRESVLLYYAALIGIPELVGALLERGADIDAEGGDFGNALTLAAYKNDIQTVKMLLEKGANPNYQTSFLGTPLQAAGIWGWEEVTRLLIVHGADPNLEAGQFGSALQMAISSGDKFLVQLLVNNGASQKSNGIFMLNRRGYRGLFSPKSTRIGGIDGLQTALYAADLEIIEILLENRASICERAGPYGTPLVAAAMNGGVEPLRLLFDKYGADPNCADNQGRTALHVAAAHDHVEAVLYMIERGGDVNKKDMKGWSAIHYAAAGDRCNVLRQLLPMWDREAFEENSWTPLHLACRFNTREALEILHDAGMMPSIVTTSQPARQWTMYDVALFHKNSDLMAENGTPLHALLDAKISNENPLPIGAYTRYEDVVQSLIRLCDSCEHEIYGPVFQCTGCDGFDYCFMCRHTAEKTHEHNNWVVLTPQDVGINDWRYPAIIPHPIGRQLSGRLFLKN